MKILDGKIIRDKIAEKLRSQILALSKVEGSDLRSPPKLVIIQVGDLPESNAYIRQKVLFGQKIGAIADHKKFPAEISQDELITHISSLNTNQTVNGIIVQLPIPNHLDKDQIIDYINPAKDVDGQTTTNFKKLIENDQTGFIPATTKGIINLLEYYKIPVKGKKVVVIGRSTLVGKPTALALLNRDATVTICHRKTKNLKEHTKSANILIVAVGKPKLITASHVSKAQIVIDVGINPITQNRVRPSSGLSEKPELEDQRSTKLVGDVDFENVSIIVAAITPVPGGIGPMTVASLFENLLEAYKHQT